jgi:hypothetical protein
MKKTVCASPFLYWSPQMRSHSATVLTPFPPTHSQEERSISQIDEEGVHAVEEPVLPISPELVLHAGIHEVRTEQRSHTLDHVSQKSRIM